MTWPDDSYSQISLIKINSQYVFSWIPVHFLILMLRFEGSTINNIHLFNSSSEVVENTKE